MGRGDEIPGRDLPDKPDLPEITQKPNDGAGVWNVKVGSRLETPLSPEERSERQLVEGFPDSIGRGFDKLPTVQNVREWYNQLSQADKDALGDPTAKVVLSSIASHTGNAEYNLELTRKSGEAVKSILKKEFGVKADIKVNPLGYDPEAAQGDDHFDRQVLVDIYPGERSAYGSDHTPDANQTDETKAGNREPVSSTDRKGTVNARESAERQKVKGFDNSIARGFNELPTEQNVRDWYNRLDQYYKDALNDPATIVELFSMASHTGDASYNEALTQRSAEEVKNILQREFGVKADFEIVAYGYDMNKPEGDKYSDRQVVVQIEPARGYVERSWRIIHRMWTGNLPKP